VWTTRRILEELRAHGARLDRILDEMRADRQELVQVVRFNTEAFRRSELAFADFRAEQQEVREDIRAHTRALLVLIGRLEGGGTAPAS
jgi:hypothetical protein